MASNINNQKAQARKSTKGLKKFLLLMTILTAYAGFVIVKFGVKDGLTATALTWAFFVTCTPIADAGFILDFPLRLLFGIKMILSEIAVWALALIIITVGYSFSIDVFDKLEILKVFRTIIENPWPLWSIVVISGIGTFMSIYIGDQIYDAIQKLHHHQKIKKLYLKRIATESLVFFFVIWLYFQLLSTTGIVI